MNKNQLQRGTVFMKKCDIRDYLISLNISYMQVNIINEIYNYYF